MAAVPDRLMKFHTEKDKKGWIDELSQLSSGTPKGAAAFRAGAKGDLDPLVRGIFYYGNRWACLMEDELAKGKTVAEVAKTTRDLADPDDNDSVTIFMHCNALHILWRFWVHGKELGDWWNKAVLGPEEGERLGKKHGLVNLSMRETPQGPAMIIALYRDLQQMGKVP